MDTTVMVLITGTVHWSVPFIGRYRALVGIESQKRPLADVWLDCAGTNRNDDPVSISARLPFGFGPQKAGAESSRVREWASQRQTHHAREVSNTHQAQGQRAEKSKAVFRGSWGANQP